MSTPTARYAICVLEDRQSRLLFVKRSLNATLGGGKWGFPGGHIEPSESAPQCALRELDEEIGPHHELVPINVLGPVRDTFYGGNFEINLFHYCWSSGTVELNHEHSEYAWVTANDFKFLEVMLGIEEDIVLHGIWPPEIFDPARLANRPRAI